MTIIDNGLGNGRDIGYPGNGSGYSSLDLDIAPKPGGSRGRKIKFTPERMEQIRNLVERGTSREEIAEIVGCTVGSLQVTCSRAGISLRRPMVLRMGPGPQQKLTPPMTTPGDGDGKDSSDASGSDGSGNGHSAEGPKDFPAARPVEPIACVLQVTLGGRAYNVPVPLDINTITALSLLAQLHDVRMGELIAKIVKDGVHGSKP